jgi:hypothetical protein
MSNSPENADNLQKLLKLKRYEQPPPGYFNNFSLKILHRIESEEEHNPDTAWIRKLLMIFETNPIAAGVFGVSVCSLLISGIAYSQYQPATIETGSSNVGFDLADAGTPLGGSDSSKIMRASSVAPSVNPMFSTNIPGSLFGELSAVPAKYSLAP